MEVGAAAGLCLLPDYYAYDFGGRRIAPSSLIDLPPVFTAQASFRAICASDLPGRTAEAPASGERARRCSLALTGGRFVSLS
ncbi:MAG: hypothetical protein JO023_17185 [Chloroflexi bacterium]|nr:hypothetical protein [Chloroflexota bacterium]